MAASIFVSHHLLGRRERGMLDLATLAIVVPTVSYAVVCAFDRPSMAIGASRGRGAPLAHAIAFPLRRDDGRVMCQAIEQRRRELLVACKHGDPFGECEIRGHDRGSTFVAIGDQIEEQFAAAAIEWDEAEHLGHKRVEITLKFYAHVLPDMQRDAARSPNARLL